MSLFGAMNAAVSGLTAQSASFGNISEDVANSQTVGFKRVDTSFTDYLTTSTAADLGMAIAGQGFFAVSQPTGVVNGSPTFNPQQYYSRAGHFTMNAAGYLVNSAGQYLNGWAVNPATNVADQNALVPIQINQNTFNPVPTANVSLSANLPATPTAGSATAASPLSSQVTVYDSLGTAHAVTLNWSQSTTNPDSWVVQVNVPDADTAATNGSPAQVDAGSADVTFGASSGNPVSEGTIGQIAQDAGDPGTMTTGGYVAGQPATLQYTTNFGSGNQAITLNLGTYGGTNGVTQFAGSTYSLLGLTQDGVAPGSFSGVTTQENGNVVVSYNNGQTRTVAQIPVVTFNAPDSLQSQNGEAFTADPSSGSPLAVAAGSNGAGSLVIGSVEGSNVDIATEFSNLIVAQQAYSSNAKVVTTANTMLQVTLQMVT
jgi:flagellar hook protein FlgE